MTVAAQPQSETFASPFNLFGPAVRYTVDAGQRSFLFWDVMRQRGNAYREHLAETAPHVLEYKIELILDGRTFDHPVNYALVRIIPPQGVEIDLTRRAFVVVDPRAGHGPGIGGFKSDSEIEVALNAGHPCYFVGFLPDPMPGQTIEDIAQAEAVFLEKVMELHPKADGKPCVIGNCQAGWAVMMLAAARPELFGPIIVAGSPLSYWAGVWGRNPMRYTGGRGFELVRRIRADRFGSSTCSHSDDVARGGRDAGQSIRSHQGRADSRAWRIQCGGERA